MHELFKLFLFPILSLSFILSPVASAVEQSPQDFFNKEASGLKTVGDIISYVGKKDDKKGAEFKKFIEAYKVDKKSEVPSLLMDGNKVILPGGYSLLLVEDEHIEIHYKKKSLVVDSKWPLHELHIQIQTLSERSSSFFSGFFINDAHADLGVVIVLAIVVALVSFIWSERNSGKIAAQASLAAEVCENAKQEKNVLLDEMIESYNELSKLYIKRCLPGMLAPSDFRVQVCRHLKKAQNCFKDLMKNSRINNDGRSVPTKDMMIYNPRNDTFSRKATRQ